MNMRSLAFLLTTSLAGSSFAVDLQIDSFTGMANSVGTFVPAASRVSNQFLDQGVLISSGGGFAAAVAELGNTGTGWLRNTPSCRIGLGGTTGGQTLSYSQPIEFKFVNPLNPTEKWVASDFSIHTDWWGNGSPISLRAYNEAGTEIFNNSGLEHNGMAPVGTSFSTPVAGIHRVVFQGSGSTAISNISFRPYTTVSGMISINGNAGPINGSAIVDLYWNQTMLLSRTVSVSPTGAYAFQLFFSGDLTMKLRHLAGLRRSQQIHSFPELPITANFVLVNGDVDESGEVDAADIDAVIAAFGNTNPPPTLVDVDGSGEVDAADIDLVIANFGATDE